MLTSTTRCYFDLTGQCWREVGRKEEGGGGREEGVRK